jgi:hypothetical protein
MSDIEKCATFGFVITSLELLRIFTSKIAAHIQKIIKDDPEWVEANNVEFDPLRIEDCIDKPWIDYIAMDEIDIAPLHIEYQEHSRPFRDTKFIVGLHSDLNDKNAHTFSIRSMLNTRKFVMDELFKYGYTANPDDYVVHFWTS